MARKKFEYSSESPDDETIIYTLEGFLFGSSQAYGFQDGLREQIAGGVKSIVIDLAAVERVDSAGLGILASVMWSASQAGARMVLASLPKQVAKLLDMALLLDRIDHADSREAALAMLE
jgi:anti-anti-sigma factor